MLPEATAVPFGWWPSPLGAAEAGAARRSRTALSSDGARLYWLESRPEESGRTVLVRADADGRLEDVSPPGVSVRSRVHEYGGGAYCLVTGARPEPAVAYVDQSDQRVWLTARGAGEPPQALSPEPSAGSRWCHGDLRATADGRFVLAVREAHDQTGSATRSVVALCVARPGWASTLLSGPGFYAAARPDRDSARLAWVSWDHPDMPWDASALWVGELAHLEDDVLAVTSARRVAGGRAGGSTGDGESVGQPTWLSDGRLLFVSDAAGWWQPWRWDPGGGAERLCAEEAEFHGADWVLGQSTLVELDTRAIACRRRRAGLDEVGVLALPTGTFEPIAQPCVSVGAICAHEGGVAWLGATPDAATGPWRWSAPGGLVGRSGGVSRVAADDGRLLDAADVSVGQPFALPTARGSLPCLFYPPALSATRGPAGARPPLVVFCHGGPTGCAEAGFDPVVQFFTSHGLAVAAVDYAGSTGYGRAYRRRLWGQWGIADPDDCAAAALALAGLGLADPSRMAIRGSSAGGFTALCALARSRVFAAAVSWYGVTDLLALAATTHDFESRYNDRLVGTLPDAVEEYRLRSPVNLVDEMEGAVLLLQGLEDPVVPPAQATAMVSALRRRGRHVVYLSFEGESHGFRRAESLAAGLAAELAFYQEVLCS